MYLGKVVEVGTRAQIYDRPDAPVHAGAALRRPDRLADRAGQARTRIVLEGDVPNPASPPSGCRFRTRCWKAQELCAQEEPALEPRAGGEHPVACHFAEVLPPSAPVSRPDERCGPTARQVTSCNLAQFLLLGTSRREEEASSKS